MHDSIHPVIMVQTNMDSYRLAEMELETEIGLKVSITYNLFK